MTQVLAFGLKQLARPMADADAEEFSAWQLL